MPLGAGVLRWVLACRTIEKTRNNERFKIKFARKIKKFTSGLNGKKCETHYRGKDFLFYYNFIAYII